MSVLLFIRCLLCLCVILLGTIGISILAVGVYLLLNIDSLIMAYVDDHIHTSIMESINVGLEFFSVPLPPIFHQVFYGLMIFGTLTLLMSIFGYCVAYQSGAMVMVFSVALGTFVLIQLVMGAFVYTKRNALHTQSKEALQLTIASNYTGIAAHNEAGLITNLWDSTMIRMRCCGVTSFRDFAYSDQWLQQGNTTIPRACCRLNDSADPRGGFLSPTCPSFPTYENSYKEVGCFPHLLKLADPLIGGFFFTVALVCLLEFMTTLFCCCIWSLVRENRNRHVDCIRRCSQCDQRAVAGDEERRLQRCEPRRPGWAHIFCHHEFQI